MRFNISRLQTKVFQRAALLALVYAIAGCERATTTTSSVEKFESSNSEIEFFEDLERNQVVSNNDALHSFFLLADKEDGWTTYDERVAEAKRRKWLSSSFDEPANESAEVGWVASASCRITKIRGGLSMQVIGPIPRYAVRELTHMQILIGKKEKQSFSGLEFVDYLTRLSRMTNFISGSVLEKLPAQATSQEPTAKPLPPTGRFE
ncbi:hypothetical protein LBMAG51_01750 [Phycisphaerae bacterium]|nr:hypothetical protein LBMAG51_01750 [Phycisphaerae bacterium]